MNYKRLKELLTQKRINIPSLAKEIGMSKAGLYLAFDKERLTVDVLEKIAEVLEVPVYVFFEGGQPTFNLKRYEELQSQYEELNERFKDKKRLIRLTNKLLSQFIKSFDEFENSLTELEKTNLRKIKSFNSFKENLIDLEEIVYSDGPTEITDPSDEIIAEINRNKHQINEH